MTRSTKQFTAAWLLCMGLCIGLGLGMPVSAFAEEAAASHADPALEARVMQVSAELRCLVCQNQTIADSHAPLAIDLRQQVRTMLQQGRSDADIYRHMTARYGDFVLYRPPLNAATALLWFGPALLLLGGTAALLLTLYRRSRLSADRFEADASDDDPDEPPLSDPALRSTP